MCVDCSRRADHITGERGRCGGSSSAARVCSAGGDSGARARASDGCECVFSAAGAAGASEGGGGGASNAKDGASGGTGPGTGGVAGYAAPCECAEASKVDSSDVATSRPRPTPNAARALLGSDGDRGDGAASSRALDIGTSGKTSSSSVGHPYVALRMPLGMPLAMVWT